MREGYHWVFVLELLGKGRLLRVLMEGCPRGVILVADLQASLHRRPAVLNRYLVVKGRVRVVGRMWGFWFSVRLSHWYSRCRGGRGSVEMTCLPTIEEVEGYMKVEPDGVRRASKRFRRLLIDPAIVEWMS